MMDIRLYQINRERDEERRALLSTEALARRGSGPKVIDSSIYDCVFEGTVNCSDLEEVYTLFNVDPPENFSGHSMSVSDVVVEGRAAFFCDSIGFRQVTFDESAARPLHRKIQVVLLEPGKLARPAAIDASLERYQKIVGGMIEAFYPFEEPVCIVCNEEGKLDGLPLNRAVYADPAAGRCWTSSPEPALSAAAAERISAVSRLSSCTATRSSSNIRRNSFGWAMTSRQYRSCRSGIRSAEARGSLKGNACGIFLASIVL